MIICICVIPYNLQNIFKYIIFYLFSLHLRQILLVLIFQVKKLNFLRPHFSQQMAELALIQLIPKLLTIARNIFVYKQILMYRICVFIYSLEFIFIYFLFSLYTWCFEMLNGFIWEEGEMFEGGRHLKIIAVLHFRIR